MRRAGAVDHRRADHPLELPYRPATVDVVLLRAPADAHALDPPPGHGAVHVPDVSAGGAQGRRGAAVGAGVTEISIGLEYTRYTFFGSPGRLRGCPRTAWMPRRQGYRKSAAPLD